MRDRNLMVVAEEAVVAEEGYRAADLQVLVLAVRE